MGLPKKIDIVEHWKHWLDEHGIDWGEPSCWACKKFWGTKYDLPILPGESLSRGWDKIPLQRCHIVPKSLGGADTADNLFLMCKECHDLAPNTIYKDVFLKWVSNQDWSIRRIDAIVREFQTYGFTKEDYEWIKNTMQDEKFNKWEEDKTGLHRNQHSHKIELTVSTTLGALYKYREMEKKQESL